MPHLKGSRVEDELNIFDSLSLREFCPLFRGATPRVGLFNINSHCGNIARTNLRVAGQIENDDTAIVRNWYARTNIPTGGPVSAAFSAWAHATTVTFIVGCWPHRQLPMSDLLARRQGQIDEAFVEANPFDINWSLTDDLDGRLHNAFYADVAPAVTMDQRSDDERLRWRRVAELARRQLCKPRPVIIPVRQSFRVDVHSDPSAIRALLEVLPTNIAPQTLVWVHLEGIRGRFTA